MFYSIGQILRDRSLLNHKGEPYKHKATISKVLRGKKFTIDSTPFGESKLYSKAIIDELNGRWKKEDNLK
jgi:hypothetical protein